MADGKDKTDDLLKQARRLQEEAQQGNASATKARTSMDATSVGQVIHEISTFNRTMAGIRSGYAIVKDVYNTFYQVFQPVWKVASSIVSPLWRGYQWLWEKTDKNSYDGWFKKKAAQLGRAVVLGLTIAAGINMIPASLGGEAIQYVTTEPVYDAGRMALFYHNKETLFLNSSSEIDQKNNVHMVKGCVGTGQCDQDSSVYFRVKPSLMHTAWNLAVNGSPFFIPDQVVAPIAPGVNKCEVTSYGARWRIVRQLQSYPYMLNAKCTSMTVKDTDGAKAAPAQQKAPATTPAAPKL